MGFRLDHGVLFLLLAKPSLVTISSWTRWIMLGLVYCKSITTTPDCWTTGKHKTALLSIHEKLQPIQPYMLQGITMHKIPPCEALCNHTSLPVWWSPTPTILTNQIQRTQVGESAFKYEPQSHSQENQSRTNPQYFLCAVWRSCHTLSDRA